MVRQACHNTLNAIKQKKTKKPNNLWVCIKNKTCTYTYISNLTACFLKALLIRNLIMVIIM